LTPRELEVLGLLIDGKANQRIARTLYITERTVAGALCPVPLIGVRL
jgi:DNA-binding CsgD family transcriptional regulator